MTALRLRLAGRLAVLLLGAALSLPSFGDADTPTTEYKVKAAMIYKLLKFIKWPDEGKVGSATSLHICILGRDPFGEAIDAVEGLAVRNFTIAIDRYELPEQLEDTCRVVFVSDSIRQLRLVLDSQYARPVLTIGDSDQFAENGGIIELLKTEKRIGFEVNQTSVEASGLQIAAPLLSLAVIIR